ncbi:MAG: hypothetical protein ACFFD1_04850, partial [Candidatus Thorarchaeota archaeon]
MFEIKKVISQYIPKDELESYNMILDLTDDICKKEIEPFAREMDKFDTRCENGKVIVHPQIH